MLALKLFLARSSLGASEDFQPQDFDQSARRDVIHHRLIVGIPTFTILQQFRQPLCWRAQSGEGVEIGT
jgi:hypothetical protein